jgi:DNA polymerase III sliding clamp (beta) subunit (PCNA family)
MEVLTADLTATLPKLNATIEKRPPKSILKYILLKKHDNFNMSLTVTDLDNWLEIIIPAATALNLFKTALIPFDLFSKAVKALRGNYTHITQEKLNLILKVNFPITAPF